MQSGLIVRQKTRKAWVRAALRCAGAGSVRRSRKLAFVRAIATLSASHHRAKRRIARIVQSSPECCHIAPPSLLYTTLSATAQCHFPQQHHF
jgi:hypothetical protein